MATDPPKNILAVLNTLYSMPLHIFKKNINIHCTARTIIQQIQLHKCIDI